jgi:glucan biosynthesis protein C
MAKMKSETRFYGLDAARASMMLLGVLLHGLVFAGQYLDNHSVVEDLVLNGVYFTFHAFRLPAFFVLAGFFACVLIERRGLDGFMRNRGMRIGLVLVIFTPIVVTVTLFVKDRLVLLGNFEVIVRRGFLHLWFVYYLLIFSVVLFLVSRIRTSARVIEFQARAGIWISDPRFLVIAPLFLLIAPGFLNKDSLIRTSTSFVPDLPLLGFYGIFFVIGTLLFHAGTTGLELLSKRAYLLCAIGLVSAQFAYGWGWTLTPGPLREFASMVASFYLALGIIGLFHRLISTTGPAWKYLSRTSYWVYLVHPPILWASLRLLKPFDLPVSTTIAIALIGAVALSFATFELFVRRTAMSKIV